MYPYSKNNTHGATIFFLPPFVYPACLALPGSSTYTSLCLCVGAALTTIGSDLGNMVFTDVEAEMHPG